MNNNYKFKNILKKFIDVEKQLIKFGEENNDVGLDLNKHKCKTLIYGYNKNREKYNKYKKKTMEGLNNILDDQMFGEGENKCIGVNVEHELVGDGSALWMADQMKFFNETCQYIEEYMDGNNMDHICIDDEDDSIYGIEGNIYNSIYNL